MDSLLLITGAGASHDVCDEVLSGADGKFRPPLTKHLFERDTRICELEGCFYVDKYLKEHELAAQVGYDFNLKYRAKNHEINLEKYLSELKNHKLHAYRAQYFAVPLYLYELFWNISNNYLSKGSPSNYKSLIDSIANSKYQRVIWLNLNYDLLADKAIKLSAYKNGLENLDRYMEIRTQDNLEIKYTKPHGSVDWFREISDFNGIWEDIKKGSIPADFEARLSTNVHKFEDIVNKTYRDEKGWDKKIFPDKYYPAVSVPVGKSYDYVYPYHMEEVKKYLRSTTTVLCIGFNALDEDILRFLGENISEIEKLRIVNGSVSSQAGESTYERIKNYCKCIKTSREHALFNGGFTVFIEREIDNWLAQ